MKRCEKILELLERRGIAEIHLALRHPSAVTADELRISHEQLHIVQPVVGEHGGSPNT